MMTSRPASGGAAPQSLVDLQRRHSRAARDDDQRVGGLAAGAHVVEIELVGAARRYRPAHRPDAGHSRQLFVHPAPFRVHRHRCRPAMVPFCRSPLTISSAAGGAGSAERSGRRPSPRSAATAHGCGRGRCWASPRRRPPEVRRPRVPAAGDPPRSTSSLPIRQVPSG